MKKITLEDLLEFCKQEASSEVALLDYEKTVLDLNSCRMWLTARFVRATKYKGKANLSLHATYNEIEASYWCESKKDFVEHLYFIDERWAEINQQATWQSRPDTPLHFVPTRDYVKQKTIYQGFFYEDIVSMIEREVPSVRN